MKLAWEWNPKNSVAIIATVLASTFLVASGNAQQPSPAANAPAASNGGAVSYQSIAELNNLLEKLEKNATVTATDLTRLKIDKWKADGETKKQAQAYAGSVSKNLQSALPGMIAGVRSNPEDLPANFKLYRNLTALYDVMAQVTELTGAFGAKPEYQSLSDDFNGIEDLRRNFADRLDALANAKQAELSRLRHDVAEAQAAMANQPIKRTVVDDNTPDKSTVVAAPTKVKSTKKKAPKPLAKDAVTAPGPTTTPK